MAQIKDIEVIKGSQAEGRGHTSCRRKRLQCLSITNTHSFSARSNRAGRAWSEESGDLFVQPFLSTQLNRTEHYCALELRKNKIHLKVLCYAFIDFAQIASGNLEKQGSGSQTGACGDGVFLYFNKILLQNYFTLSLVMFESIIRSLLAHFFYLV